MVGLGLILKGAIGAAADELSIASTKTTGVGDDKIAILMRNTI
jgi:hypothetical protein